MTIDAPLVIGIPAPTIQHAVRVGIGGEGIWEIAVALKAEERLTHLQERFVRRGMRIMTEKAVFLHREVVEQIRASLVRMASVAILIDRRGGQEPGGIRSMRGVTGGAGHLCIIPGEVRGTEGRDLFLQMASEAKLFFRGPAQKILPRHLLHNLVAIHTSLCSAVDSPVPVIETPLIMTRQADGILLFPCVLGLRAKGGYKQTLFIVFNVEAPWSMTGLTLHPGLLCLFRRGEARQPFCMEGLVPFVILGRMATAALFHAHVLFFPF